MATRKQKPARHREQADEHAATELVMYIENTSDLSPDGPSGQGRSVLLNALRKWKKGTYDPALAVRLFEYLVEAGAKRYAKEFDAEKNWSTMFNPTTRHEAAKQLETSFRNSAENGEYDHVDTRIGGPREASEGASRFDPKLKAHINRVADLIGHELVNVHQDHRGVLIWRGIRPGSPNADIIRLDAREHGLFYAEPWANIDEVEVSSRHTREVDARRRRRPPERLAEPHHKRPLPHRLYDAYEWISSAGEWEDALSSPEEYARDAAANAAEHGHSYITESDLLEVIEWFQTERRGTSGRARLSERKYSMTYGKLPSFERFEQDVHTRINPDYDKPYWPKGTLYPMELVSSHEIELAETFGLEEFETERQITGRNTRVRGFRDNERAIYEFLEFLVDRWNNGDEEAGDLASTIMSTLGYEWI